MPMQKKKKKKKPQSTHCDKHTNSQQDMEIDFVWSCYVLREKCAHSFGCLGFDMKITHLWQCAEHLALQHKVYILKVPYK